MNERASRIAFAYELLLAVPVFLGAMVYLVVALWPAPYFDHFVGQPATAAIAALVGASLLACGGWASWVFLRHGRAGLARVSPRVLLAMRIGAWLVAVGAVALIVVAGSGWRPLMSLGVMGIALPLLVPYARLQAEAVEARDGDPSPPPPPMPWPMRVAFAVTWTACFAIALGGGLLFAQFPFFEWVAHRDYADCLGFAEGTPISVLEARFGTPERRGPGDVDFDPSPGYTLAFSTGVHVRFDPATGRTTDIYCGEGW